MIVGRLQAEDTKGSLLALIGPRGTGKTQLAVEIAKAYVSFHCKPIKYIKLFGMFLELKESFNGGSEREVIRNYVNPDLLIIDEIHEKLDGVWTRGTFTHLIDLRYDAMKPTILIGNVDKKEFAEVVGSSVYSRLTEVGGIVQCSWDSFRKRGE